MTRGPEFDDLVGADVEGEERERLHRVHELLLQAGPPAELSPEIAQGPTLAMTLGRDPRRGNRRVLLIAAALAVTALVFLGGYITGNSGGNGLASGKTLQLHGTTAAPAALASLQIQPEDAAGNWPMKLAVTGLPKLAGHGYYVVWLARNGKPIAPCGTFLTVGAHTGTSVWLNAPYTVKPGDTWIVTRQQRGDRTPGTVVLTPNA
jgi:hypothetical protein